MAERSAEEIPGHRKQKEVIAHGEDYIIDVELRCLLMTGITLTCNCIGMWDFRIKWDDKSGGKTVRRRRNKRSI